MLLPHAPPTLQELFEDLLGRDPHRIEVRWPALLAGWGLGQ